MSSHYLIKYKKIYNMVAFYTICEKYIKIQLTKNKMDLKNKKIKNCPPFPGGSIQRS